MFGEQCCTYIPNNTTPDGGIAKAFNGLGALSAEMRTMAGVEESGLFFWLGAWFGKYTGMVVTGFLTLILVFVLLMCCAACIIPCFKKSVTDVTLTCLIPLMTTDNPSCNCSAWDAVYPMTKSTARKPLFSNKVARAHFTCVKMTGGGTNVGQVPGNWCLDTINIVGSFRPISRADVGWWCGNTVLFDKLPSNTTGSCALVTLLLPVSIYPTEAGDLILRVQRVNPEYWRGRSRRATTPSSGDPTYIDAIGVPRGVPDEYKLVDQVAAGFESSICWWCTVNKNVDRIHSRIALQWICYRQRKVELALCLVNSVVFSSLITQPPMVA